MTMNTTESLYRQVCEERDAARMNLAAYQQAGGTIQSRLNLIQAALNCKSGDEIEAIRALAGQASAAPIDMILHCPSCGKQHIDAPESLHAYGDRLNADLMRPGPSDKRICHSPGERCAGCPHYRGEAEVCTYAEQGGELSAETIDALYAAEINKGGSADSIIIRTVRAALAADRARRPADQHAAMAHQVCLNLHAALGVKWGDDPYAKIKSLIRPAVQQVADEMAWLVEWRYCGHIHYLMSSDFYPGFSWGTVDQALRFCRESDAKAILNLVARFEHQKGRELLAVEHIWPAPEPKNDH